MTSKIQHVAEEYDVIIIGAGISGIGAAYRLMTECPSKNITILEARGAMGGTWDLFRYPGVRSDSDMFTMGYTFYPWEGTETLASGPSILQYIKDTAAAFGIDKKIQYHHRVEDASWNEVDRRWLISIAGNDIIAEKKMSCKFLMMCSGYYDYNSGYEPEFPGINTFKGIKIHPQKWDPELDYEDKTVIVIGSGATAVTLVPAMAEKASKVYVLQRSPTYMLSVPQKDTTAQALKKLFPSRVAYHLIRWKNILFNMWFYRISKKYPALIASIISKKVKKELGPDYDMRHFTPNYRPWDQRLCAVPDSDFFRAIKAGKVDMITDEITRFTSKGILLKSGKELDADIIVTATGLKIQLLGGMTMHVHGKRIDTASRYCYRGVLFSDVPNFAITVGYVNASWTLKCDLNSRFVTRLLNFMDKHSYTVCTPRFDETVFGTEPFSYLTSGFILRADNVLPKQGTAHPWKVYQSYLRDLISLKLEDIDEKHLEFRS